MANFYPAFFNLEGRKCVVVGAGEVAARKAQGLVECGALVTVVGRRPAAGILRMTEEGTIELVEENYGSGHLEGAFLVVGATDDEAVNRRVHKDAEGKGIPVNIVDRPELCNFIVPAVLRRDDLTVAVSTAGRSPAMAKRIRDEIEANLDEGFGPLLVIMGVLRERVLARGQSSEENRRLFETLADSPLTTLVREERWGEAERIIFEITGEELVLPDLLRNESSKTGGE